MLEKYSENYKEFYKIINNAISENKISHAYMFEIDDNIDINEFEKDLCKALLNPMLSKDEIFQLIDKESYPNIKKIKSDGLWIKKEQILEIQNDFRKESFDNNLKIYIIEDASKLNKSSANTLLKFLEEPEKNIVAILLTKNRYSVIDTIVSRCINISLKKKNYLTVDKNNVSYQFVEIVEKYELNALPYLYQLIFSHEYDRNEIINIMEDVQKIYCDLLHYNNNVDDRYNYYSSNLLNDIFFVKDNDLLIKKIEVISKNCNFLKNNLNIKTFLDKIIIDIYGGE